MNGGLVLASGASGAEESFDCEISSQFIINGGILIGTAGNYMTAPSSNSSQKVVLYCGLSMNVNEKFCILDSDNIPLVTFSAPRTMNNMVLFLSLPDFETGKSYSITKNGAISDFTDSWNGWYEGGKWTDGSSAGSFTTSNNVTIIGRPNSGGFPSGTSPR